MGRTLCSQQHPSSHTQSDLPLPAAVCEYPSQGTSCPHSERPRLPPHSHRPCSLCPVNPPSPLPSLPSLTGPEPHSSTFLPQGLCICCSHCLDTLSPVPRWLPSLRPLLKCYLLGQVFPDHPIYICTYAYPLHSLSSLQAYFPPKHL